MSRDSNVVVFQSERGNWRILLSSYFRRTSVLLWYSWWVFASAPSCSLVPDGSVFRKHQPEQVPEGITGSRPAGSRLLSLQEDLEELDWCSQKQTSGTFLLPPQENRGTFVVEQEVLTSVLLLRRFVASFSYYGSVLSSSELLEKNLLCVTDAGEEHAVKHRLEDGLCYCISFASSDYETLLISSLGEVARKSWGPPGRGPCDPAAAADVCVTTSGLVSPVVPLNIGLLTVFGRKMTMVVLQLLTALFFMLLNICSTM